MTANSRLSKSDAFGPGLPGIVVEERGEAHENHEAEPVLEARRKNAGEPIAHAEFIGVHVEDLRQEHLGNAVEDAGQRSAGDESGGDEDGFVVAAAESASSLVLF